MSKSYFISHLREGSINLGDRVVTEIKGTYQDAVNAAHEIFNAFKSKQGVTVHSDSHCLYFWHYIKATGEVEDRNTNSGVQHPTKYAIRYDGKLGYVAA